MLHSGLVLVKRLRRCVAVHLVAGGDAAPLLLGEVEARDRFALDRLREERYNEGKIETQGGPYAKGN